MRGFPINYCRDSIGHALLLVPISPFNSCNLRSNSTSATVSDTSYVNVLVGGTFSTVNALYLESDFHKLCFTPKSDKYTRTRGNLTSSC